MTKNYKNYAHQKRYEPKTVNNKPNPKYVDLLDEDPSLSGQKFVCISFISPEDIIKQKDHFYFEQFLKSWDYNNSMKKFTDFLNFMSHKHNLNFDVLYEDFKQFVEDEHETLKESSISDDYKTFIENNETKLLETYNKKVNFQTSTRGIKIRGTYGSQEEADIRCKLLREKDPVHDIYVGEVGMWMPFNPDAYKTGRVEYMEEELNKLMFEKNKNDAASKQFFDERVKETKEKAIKENRESSEKTGNKLSQTIDENGNLIGLKVTGKQTDFTDEANVETITQEEITQNLFEGDNIVTGKTDYGKSLLKSGPLASKKL